VEKKCHDPPTPPSSREEKQALRELLRAQRGQLSPVGDSVEARAASVAVAAQVDGALRWPKGGRVAVYAAVRGELDTGPLAELARLRGSRIFFPRLAEPAGLSFHEVSDLAELVLGPFGIPAPTADRAPATGLDVVVVPGLGFDAAGGRLGFGRGCYDRALSADPTALRIGVGYDWQVISRVPSEPHDEPLDLVVTPTRCIVTAARPAHALCRGLHHKEKAT
jgi:5-formyltetrahydrofolate cyclo-ligase